MTARTHAQTTGKPTPGPWLVGRDCIMKRDANGNPERHIVEYCWPDSEAQAHADHCLIAEAGTVYHETGLTPRQLADQRAELLAALERTLSWLTSYPGSGAMGKTGPYEQARAAIARCKVSP